MDVTPGYKITEVGLLPKDWSVKRIEELGTVVRGASPRPAGDPRYFNGNFIPWLTVAALTNIAEYTLEVTDTVDFLTEEGSKHSRMLPAGTLIIANSGATLGVAKVLGVTCCANDGIAAIVYQKYGDRRFICHYINANTENLREVVATGNGQPNLNTGLIRGISLPYPPLPEQRAIASVLSDVDALLAGLDRLIAKKRDLKQAAMQQLLTGKIRLGGFTGEWTVKSFDNVLDRLNAKVCQIKTSDYQHMGKYPIVDQGKQSIVGFSDQIDKCFRCPDGGVIVFGDHTCSIKFISFDFLVGADGTQILKGKAGQNTRFHAFQLQYRGVEPTGYNRHFKFVKERDYLVPSQPEQTAISSVLSDIDAEISALEARRDKTRALKQGMMQELLTGRIRLV